MRVLLDTSTFLWMAFEPQRLSPATRQLLATEESQLLLSAASSWEIAIKWKKGKLRLPEDPAAFIRTRASTLSIDLIPIHHAHVVGTADLPLHHHDPFDRLLVAVALTERVPLVTPDTFLDRYGVAVIPT